MFASVKNLSLEPSLLLQLIKRGFDWDCFFVASDRHGLTLKLLINSLSFCFVVSDRLQTDIETVDPRGRTPLHLAVTLDHLDCAKVLLQHGADVSKENRNGWTVLQEAVSTRDPELVRLVLRYRDYQRTAKRLAGIPVLLERLRQAEDFYVEMKWEFTSWVPLVSRICPSDTYRVWKSGQCLRVDTTLMGFEQMTWQRGNRSFIFRGRDSSAEVMEVDHDRQLVTVAGLGLLGAMKPSNEQVAARLSAPVVTTQLDTRNITFERNKTGILGWRSEKTEMVNGYEAKVYAASNVELITRTRSDHLTDKNKTKGDPLHWEGCTQKLGTNKLCLCHNCPHGLIWALVTQMSSPAVTNPAALTVEEYFNPGSTPTLRDIGHPCHLTTKTQRFKAKMWLCESHPLSLAEQVVPIIDLMAISNALFAKLRDFITLRLPPGFPVKIEIPLYHILNARITFSNLNGCEAGANARSDNIPPCVFEPPPGYTMLGGKPRDSMREEEEDLLQFAIQQSLLEAGSEYDQVTIWEALTNSKPGAHPLSCDPSRVERWAVHVSLRTDNPRPPTSLHSTPAKKQPPACSYDRQLRIAMEISAREQEEADLRRRREEEDLQRIIQLSLMEK
uniref:Ankyrin repeat domain 13B n=1 Tax=Oryzias latipes TaxID=8090 RepID=A0A3P9M2E6_ORYLA